MIKFCILLFLAFNCVFVFAQNVATDSSAPVVAYWQKAEKKQLSITRTTQKTNAGKAAARVTNTCEASLQIKDSTAEEYTIEWTYKDAGSAVKGKPQLNDLNSLLTNLKIIYTTDDVGMFKELVNYEEMRSFLHKAMDAMFKLAQDTTGLYLAKKELLQIFSSRESLEQILLRDIALYHSAYGLEYSFTPHIEETALPNFLGGDPWPAHISLKLSQLKPKQNFAQVYIDQEIDQEKAAVIMKQFVSKMAASQGKEVPQDEMPTSLIIKDHTEFDIILSTGWIKRVYMKRFAKTGDLEKVDTYEIVMK